ncbi:MAG: NAD(P)-dependent oxidoreductase [Candidatus Heimdallarchaeaceae archaeon]
MQKEKQVNVLCIWQPNEELKQYLTLGLEDYPQVNLIFPPDTEEETYLKLAPNADIIMGWRPTKELLQTAKKVKLFINPGAGVQHLISLFQEVTKEQSITLVNGHGNSDNTAQHAVALLLALTNKVVLHHNWMKEGHWRKGDNEAVSLPLQGRKIGFLGYGAVNRKVHKLLSGFDVEFSVLRRDWKKQASSLPTLVKQYKPEEFPLFLKAIDTLIVAVPLTAKTKGMIGKQELELLGKEGLIVNMARGEVINEEAFYYVLKEEKILGAAIDVWYDYRPEPDEKGEKHPSSYPFHELDNVILSPHRAASPFSVLTRWDEQIENISRFARGEREFLNEVNLEEGY